MLLKNKIEIEKWLIKYNIFNYELIEDIDYGYVVNVSKCDDVKLSYFNLKSIDVKFNVIKGSFYCNNNELTSLEGCPEIVNGEFSCSNNKLTSLIGCPNIVNDEFLCYNNLLNIKGIKNLINIEIKSNFISMELNKELGNLKNKSNFNEIKQILIINKEKQELDLFINNKKIPDFIKSVVEINNDNEIITNKIKKI